MKHTLATALIAALISLGVHANPINDRYVQIQATTMYDRSEIENLGVSIEGVRSDCVWGFASPSAMANLAHSRFKILSVHTWETGRGGHGGVSDFPSGDARFHNYARMVADLQALAAKYPALARLHDIGKTVEGRSIPALQINTTPASLVRGQSNKPGVIFLGNHHAREHLSLEVPLMLAHYLLENAGSDSRIRSVVENRDIWIVPMVNPDGAEFDIQTGQYQMWRKNRRDNKDGTFGVDLNRNYGYKWGTGGSSTNTDSEVYMGPSAFSEPETQNVKAFIEAHLNAKVLLTFHTFSELILYPWGHQYNPIDNSKDHAVFETMAKKMATWNHYKPEQASQLYITSGDTTDWAYGEHGIFAFTFELSPSSMFGGGFYPGAKAIDPTFAANLNPCLYLIGVADDPYKVIQPRSMSREFGYIGPTPSASSLFELHPQF